MFVVRTMALCAALVVAVAAIAAEDPWMVPAPSGIELTMTLMGSEAEYAIQLAGKPWKDANGPEHVEVPVSKGARIQLAKCRALVRKGEVEPALEAIGRFVSKNPANWDAHLLHAQILQSKGAHAEAAAALRTSLIGNRRNPDAWKLLDTVAKALGKQVLLPRLPMRGWVRKPRKGAFEVGHVADDADGMPWNYYASARAVYRFEGPFERDFRKARSYRFTFREQMFAMGVLANSAAQDKADGTKLSAGLKRVLAEKKAGTLVEFAFFAAYPEPIPRKAEPGWDTLLPRLEKYFDESILVAQ